MSPFFSSSDPAFERSCASSSLVFVDSVTILELAAINAFGGGDVTLLVSGFSRPPSRPPSPPTRPPRPPRSPPSGLPASPPPPPPKAPPRLPGPVANKLLTRLRSPVMALGGGAVG